MLKYNIIKRYNTEYINPIVTAPKKDDSVRLCLDARNLNKRLRVDSSPGHRQHFSTL